MTVSQQNTSGVVIGEIRQLDLLKKENESINDEIRMDAQEKSYYYYVGDSAEIIEYLENCIDDVFGDEITKDNEWLYDWLNITEKLINRQAIVYKDPAERFFEGEETESEELTEEDELTDYYNNIIPSDVNSKNKKAHRFAKLFNTSLTQVSFNKTTGKVEYLIEPSHKLKVIPDENDYMKISEISYEKEFKNEKGMNEVYTVVWNKTEHYKKDALGKKTAIGNNEGMANPYKDQSGEGIIPFAVLRLNEGEDFWGIGAEDIVNVNEIVNFLLTFLLNDSIVLGSGGVLLAVNLGLDKKGEEGESSGVKKVRASRRKPIVVETKGQITDNIPPSLSYVNTQPLITEIQNTIDYRIKQIAVLKGLNPNTILSAIKDTSDYQKMMDSLEQIEVRRDDLEPCRNYEKELFDITRVVNNTAAKDPALRTKFELQEIPWDIELSVDFAEIKIEKTNQELWADRNERLKLNLITPVDILIEENPDLSEDDAKKRLEDNRLINTTIGTNQKPSLFETIMNKNQANNQMNNQNMMMNNSNNKKETVNE